jgi:4-hydroxybenzoate polyprenyltransferase
VSLWKLPWTFAAILAAYLAATLTYSFWLRRKVLVDVLALAGLYTLRVLAGGAATAVDVSEWLMAFAVFLFLSLAFAKRYAELARLADEAKPAATGRGYALSDLDFIRNVGPTSGYLAVLVFALYVNSDAMRQFYNNRWALWLICPLMLYWISRMWIMAMRRKLAEDPLVFALRDPVSLLVGLLSVALLIVAGRASL